MSKLKLDRIRISGFKSFSDQTEVVFPDGITAVVGPNGCGKSNIGDALNWVLGEQSARMLRGASMQDVIFNGSEARKPVGMAEVSVEMSGLNGTPDGATRDVVLTRRLFRDGESEYLVNGARARLKDIQEILREARVGTQTYATIEQGRIDQILNAKPRERRLLIEEAAGISGYKHKRRLAELKLEATQANLLRVGDIVAEVRRQISSLKRQAAKARRYQRLRDELRSKESVRFGARARRMDEDLARLMDEEREARASEAGAAADLGRAEAALEADRVALSEAEGACRLATDRLHQLDLEIDRERTRSRSCQERIEEARERASELGNERDSLRARRESAREELRVHLASTESERVALEEAAAALEERRSELERAQGRLAARREGVEHLRRRLFEAMNDAAEARNRRRAIEEAIGRGSERRARLGEERAEVIGELSRLEVEAGRIAAEATAHASVIERLREEHGAADRALAEARERVARDGEALAAARGWAHSAAARLRTLEDVATRFAGVSDGVKLLLTLGAAAGVRTGGVLADFVEAAREIESPAEAYLQAILPAVIVEDDADAVRAAELIRSEGAGRTLLLSRSQPAGRSAEGGRVGESTPFPDPLVGDSRVLGRLRERLSLASGADELLRDRIGDAVLVDRLESALALHRLHPETDYLTPDGEAVLASGLVSVGGRVASDHGLLAHKRRTQEARGELAEAEARAAALQAGLDAARAENAGLESEVERLRSALEEAGRRRVELSLGVERSAAERERMGRRAAVLSEEVAAIDEESERITRDHGDVARVVEECEAAQRVVEQDLAAEGAGHEEMERRLREQSESAAVLQADVLVRQQRRSVMERERVRLEASLAEVESRLGSVLQEIDAARARAEEAEGVLARTAEELAGHLTERERRAAEAAAMEAAVADGRRGLDQREAALKEMRAALERRRESVQAAEVALAGAAADRRHLDELCVQELGISAAQAALSRTAEIGGSDAESLDADIADLRQKIEAMGPVNLTAIEEFSELEKRYTFLTSQQHDLEHSMESLRETIRRINRQSRERFSDAFEAIRVSFQEVFRTLFNGGRADLWLEEGDDVLETGVEIMVQPPGKRLGNVHLLSGGEKAMAAIALLFAIFRYQPSPFCLLDEVDAALDDVNVNRFTKMLREYAEQTQFIMITHNKRSMETADLLYGVTMEEPGVSKLVSLKL
ncbi:MAG: chromosome segregation protein SMC [Acidobacteriia bacterium]|nr:chromosome segregation protein SMC [Terriglobia bacterium]